MPTNKQRHDKLIMKLGGECKHCGSKFLLELDHIEGDGTFGKHSPYYERIKSWKNEEELQVLCGPCNKKKYKEWAKMNGS